MADRIINVKLNGDYLNSLAKYFRNLGNSAEQSIDNAVENITRMGYEFLISIIPVGKTGELRSATTWSFNKSTNIGTIHVGTKYAVFVNFGTGIIGASNPVADLPAGYQYQGGTGKKDTSGGWWYFDEFDSNWWYTHGQRGQNFMYRTMEYMKSIAGSQLKFSFKAFGGDGK